jgi:predicted nucleic acid-binding protein
VTFLTDANIVSEPTKPEPDARVREWLRRYEPELVVDPIILGEVRYGILKLPPGKKRQKLEHWFGDVVMGIVCLPWDAAIAIRWAELLANLRRSGMSMPLKDSMIAATALTHGLTIVTRNGRDFQKAGLSVVNPFE